MEDIKGTNTEYAKKYETKGENLSEESISGIIATHDKLFKGKITYDKGKITKVERGPTKADIEFSSDCIIFPGFIDKHTHPREYPLPDNATQEEKALHSKHLAKEDFLTLSEAAIAGGVTLAGCILNTPRPATSQKLYNEYIPLSKKSKIPLVLYAMIAPGTEPFGSDKIYKFMWSSVGGADIKSDSEVPGIIKPYGIMSGAGQLRSAFHCESIDELAKLADKKTHEDRRGYPVQETAIKIALNLQEELGFELDIMHISTNKSLELIMEAVKKDRHVPVTAEACPHHLLLSRENINKSGLKYADMFFMNPALQYEKDKSMLMPELGRIISCVSSDHAGHTKEDKEKGAAGITGLQAMGPAAAELMKKHEIPAQTIAKIFSYNPGQIMSRFGAGFVGDITFGYTASFTVLNLAKPMKMSDEYYTPKCGWNAWAGYEFAGSVEAAFVKGKRML